MVNFWIIETANSKPIGAKFDLRCEVGGGADFSKIIVYFIASSSSILILTIKYVVSNFIIYYSKPRHLFLLTIL